MGSRKRNLFIKPIPNPDGPCRVEMVLLTLYHSFRKVENLVAPAVLHLNFDGLAIRISSANQGAVSSAG